MGWVTIRLTNGAWIFFPSISDTSFLGLRVLEVGVVCSPSMTSISPMPMASLAGMGFTTP